MTFGFLHLWENLIEAEISKYCEKWWMYIHRELVQITWLFRFCIPWRYVLFFRSLSVGHTTTHYLCSIFVPTPPNLSHKSMQEINQLIVSLQKCSDLQMETCWRFYRMCLLLPTCLGPLTKFPLMQDWTFPTQFLDLNLSFPDTLSFCSLLQSHLIFLSIWEPPLSDWAKARVKEK